MTDSQDILNMTLNECIDAYLEDPTIALEDTPEVFENFKKRFVKIDDSSPMPPIKVTKECMPCLDPVFTAIMQDSVLLKEFMDAVTGENIEFKEDTITAQHELSYAKVDSKRIRLDTHAVDKNGRSYSIDMQRIHSKRSRRTQKRGWYYAAHQYSSQAVTDMRYENLNGVFVTFILSDSKDEGDGFYHDFISRQDSKGNVEKFYDIMNVYEIYAPNFAVENPVINIFMRFFSIKNEDDAVDFSARYGSTRLGRRLAKSYAVVSEDRSLIAKLEREDYFMRKTADEIKRDIAETSRREGLEEGMEIGMEKGMEKLILSIYSSLYGKNPSQSKNSIINSISELCKLSEADVGSILNSAGL